MFVCTLFWGVVTCQAARLATSQILNVLGWHLCKCAILPLVTCIQDCYIFNKIIK